MNQMNKTFRNFQGVQNRSWKLRNKAQQTVDISQKKVRRHLIAVLLPSKSSQGIRRLSCFYSNSLTQLVSPGRSAETELK